MIEKRSDIASSASILAKENYDYDLARFQRFSSAVQVNHDPVALAAALTSAYHSVEKGLAMEATRAGFAAPKIAAILKMVTALESGGNAGLATRGARGTLQAYVRFHDQRGLNLPSELAAELREFVDQMESDSFPGGSTTLSKKEVEDATSFDFSRFVQTRYSIRHFTGESVSPAAVETAVGQAIKTPPTCNREMRRVYAAYDPDLRDYLLTFQRGNIGFGHKLGAALIVAVDLRQFDIIGERNQCWIDGGLFAMTLVYAFHAARFGTCMLNWSADREQDAALRRAFDIPDHEVIITCLGVGHLPEVLQVAASPAPTAQEVLQPLVARSPRLTSRK